MKFLVPERAMVPALMLALLHHHTDEKGYIPRLLMRSALVIPIPVSWRVRVLASLSGMMWMKSSGAPSSLLLSVRDS